MYENRMDEKQTVMIPKKMNIVYLSSQKSVLGGLGENTECSLGMV